MPALGWWGTCRVTAGRLYARFRVVGAGPLLAGPWIVVLVPGLWLSTQREGSPPTPLEGDSEGVPGGGETGAPD